MLMLMLLRGDVMLKKATSFEMTKVKGRNRS